VGEISDPALATPENLVAVRAEELAEACRLLGVARRFNLGYRDSGMMGTADNDHPNAFWRADMDDATGRLVRILREVRPDVIVTSNERGDYGHPDHINTNRVATAAFHAAGDPARYPEQGLDPWRPRRLFYSAWPRSHFERMRDLLAEAGIAMDEEEESTEDEIGMPDEVVTAAVDILSYLPAKRAALAAHRTQMGPESLFMRMPESIWRQVWAAEYFRQVFPEPAASHPLDDLFAGLR
jgi:LmbE family N-acetylglucosaminyl deacetylase